MKRWAWATMTAFASTASVVGQAPQSAPPAASSAPAKDGDVVVIRTSGQPDRHLRVLRISGYADGESLADVQDVTSGAKYTIPAKVLAAMASRNAAAPAAAPATPTPVPSAAANPVPPPAKPTLTTAKLYTPPPATTAQGTAARPFPPPPVMTATAPATKPFPPPPAMTVPTTGKTFTPLPSSMPQATAAPLAQPVVAPRPSFLPSTPPPATTPRAYATPDGSDADVVLIRTAGQPDRRVKVLRLSGSADGETVADVQDLASGSKYTIPAKVLVTLMRAAPRTPATVAAMPPPPVNTTPIAPPVRPERIPVDPTTGWPLSPSPAALASKLPQTSHATPGFRTSINVPTPPVGSRTPFTQVPLATPGDSPRQPVTLAGNPSRPSEAQVLLPPSVPPVDDTKKPETVHVPASTELAGAATAATATAPPSAAMTVLPPSQVARSVQQPQTMTTVIKPPAPPAVAAPPAIQPASVAKAPESVVAPGAFEVPPPISPNAVALQAPAPTQPTLPPPAAPTAVASATPGPIPPLSATPGGSEFAGPVRPVVAVREIPPTIAVPAKRPAAGERIAPTTPAVVAQLPPEPQAIATVVRPFVPRAKVPENWPTTMDRMASPSSQQPVVRAATPATPERGSASFAAKPSRPTLLERLFSSKKPTAPEREPAPVVPAAASEVASRPIGTLYTMQPVTRVTYFEPVPVNQLQPNPVEYRVPDRMDDEIREYVTDLTTATRPAKRERAAVALAEGRYGWKPEVKAHLALAAKTDATPSVRVRCIELLSKLGYHESAHVDYLEELAAVSVPEVQKAAKAALAKLAPK